MKYKIQNLLFVQNAMCNEQDMYYRVSGDVKQIEDVIYINKHEQ